ncbi:hypothetical protein HI914_00825 [Erysiphe necator]|nr:hypothetical protein HI914_00825 [Erysiphe necator]
MEEKQQTPDKLNFVDSNTPAQSIDLISEDRLPINERDPKELVPSLILERSTAKEHQSKEILLPSNNSSEDKTDEQNPDSMIPESYVTLTKQPEVQPPEIPRYFTRSKRKSTDGNLFT